MVQSIQQAVRNGFTYLKINHLNLGELTGGKRTAFEIYRDNYTAIRKAAGEDTYLAYCDSSPNRLTVGLADAGRIGADANRTARSVYHVVSWHWSACVTSGILTRSFS